MSPLTIQVPVYMSVPTHIVIGPWVQVDVYAKFEEIS